MLNTLFAEDTEALPCVFILYEITISPNGDVFDAYWPMLLQETNQVLSEPGGS